MANEVEIIVRARDLASATLDKTAAKAEGIGGRFGPLGKAAGLAIGGIGLAAAGAAYEGVKMASTFQSSMEQLHTQAHVPQKAVDQLSQSVLGLAGKVGQGPDSLSEALYHIESSFASTGISGSKAMHLLQTSSEGAKLGHADLVDVTNALDAAVVSGIPGVKNFDQAMGMLNATVGAGDMHMQDLASAFGTGAVAVVKGYGLTLRDVGAALAVFGDNNIRGAKAGTQLRMTVQSLAVPAKTGAAALAELGLKQDTLAKDMQSGGLIKAVTDLHEHLKKTGHLGKESGQILTEAFGKKAGVGVQMLLDQFDRLKSKYVEIDKGANTFSEAWDAQKKTFKQGWDDFTAGVEAALTKLGLKLLPMLEKALPKAGAVAIKAIDGLSKAIDVTRKVLDPLIGIVQDHATIFGTLAVTIGTLVVAWKLWVGAIKVWEGVTKAAIAVQAAFDAVLDANPIALIIIAIAALAAGLIYAYTHSKKFRDIVDDIAGAVSNAAKAVWNFGVRIMQVVARAVAFVIDRFGDMATFVGNVLSHIPGMGAAGAALKRLGGQAHAAANMVRAVATAMEGIKSKDVTLRVQTLTSTQMIRQAGGFHEGMAHGGIGGHAAEGGPRSNDTLVGEHGPELVHLAPGSTVHSNPDTERMLAEHKEHKEHEEHLAHLRRLGSLGELDAHLQHQYNKRIGIFNPHKRAKRASSSTAAADSYSSDSSAYTPEPAKVVVELDINSGGSAMDDLLVQIMRKSIRSRGGNVQTVLGT